MSLTRFDAYVDRHAAAHVERLQALCRMPSIAARGTGMRSIAEFVAEQMQRAGGGTRFVEYEGGHPVIFGEFGAGTSCYIVYGHYDVQPVGALAEWTSGPFAAALVDGKLRARGASDSKGDLLARLVAIEAYQKTFGKLPVCLRFIVEGEDALGSPSLRRFIAENEAMLKADGCIWDDGYKDTRERLVTSLGFKGIAFLSQSQASDTIYVPKLGAYSGYAGPADMIGTATLTFRSIFYNLLNMTGDSITSQATFSVLGGFNADTTVPSQHWVTG